LCKFVLLLLLLQATNDCKYANEMVQIARGHTKVGSRIIQKMQAVQFPVAEDAIQKGLELWDKFENQPENATDPFERIRAHIELGILYSTWYQSGGGADDLYSLRLEMIDGCLTTLRTLVAQAEAVLSAIISERLSCSDSSRRTVKTKKIRQAGCNIFVFVCRYM